MYSTHLNLHFIDKWHCILFKIFFPTYARTKFEVLIGIAVLYTKVYTKENDYISFIQKLIIWKLYCMCIVYLFFFLTCK